MTVLKFSSAAVIVLLLFFASLPPSVGNDGRRSKLVGNDGRRSKLVEVKKPKHVRRSKLVGAKEHAVGVEEHAVGVEEQNEGRRSKLETSQPRCRVPEIKEKEGFTFDIEGWNSGIPTADWFNNACDRASESSCTREEAVDEIMKEASKQITATKEGKKAPPETLTELKKAFRELVKRGLELRDIRDGNRIIKIGHMLKAFVKLPFNSISRACRNLGEYFDVWELEIDVLPDDYNEFCKKYRKILRGRTP